ncbi:oligosaccharide flippase family protein [Enterobacter hormaechei]|uniref:lipopolysaccharide biosynthesis protein n=1 Tax=Enterobacter hormaechei TaxID=158836 RepID=UPI003F4214F9
MKNIKNFFSYALGDFFVKGMLFISLPLLTRIMSPEEYGKLSILNTAILILYVFTSLNLQSAVLNRYMKNKNNFETYLGSCLIFLVPFHIILLVTARFYENLVSNLLGFSSSDFISVLFICMLLSYIFIYVNYLQAAEDGTRYVKINVITKLAEIVLIFIFAVLLTKNQYLSKIYAQFIVCIPMLLYCFLKLKKIASFDLKFIYIKEALFFSVPLVVHVLSNSLLSQVDRVIINDILGNAAAGIYSFSYNLGMCVIVVIMAWNSSWQPRLFKLINDKQTEKISLVNKNIALLIFFISSGCVLFSKEMVIVASNKDYYAGIDIVPLIVIGNALIHIYLTYVNFVFYKKKTILISCTTLLALIINIIANYVLIPIYGIVGSAIATLIAYLALCIFHFFTAKYIIGIYNSSLVSIKLLSFYFIGLMTVYGVMIVLNKQELLYSIFLKLVILMFMLGYIIKTKAYIKVVA